ncbi:MAG: peptidase M14 [Planctomycetota bacterium]|nr:peptidase M14 [Planctomycetota bacterium]
MNVSPVIDCDFPGGNIIVEKIEGDTACIRQDLRDTEGDWFYWCFRVRGAAGGEMLFQFTGSKVIGVRGPAVSTDGGTTWAWLGCDAVENNGFTYAFADEAEEVRFCVAMPYLEANLRRFLDRHRDNPHLDAGVLCRSRKGREVELLRLGRIDGDCKTRALLTCRHHCCEMMADWALEGIMETILGAGDDGRWFRENVEFMVAPFVDKDGVEDGDQGKNRLPRDHNRDYEGPNIYPETGALRELVPEWSAGRLRFALDMHCPGLRGEGHEDIQFVGTANEENWSRVERFSEILEAVRAGPLIFSSENNLPFGRGWNTSENFSKGKSFARWAEGFTGTGCATAIEIPYASAGGSVVTTETARALGQDLAGVIRRFLQQEC